MNLIIIFCGLIYCFSYVSYTVGKKHIIDNTYICSIKENVNTKSDMFRCILERSK